MRALILLTLGLFMAVPADAEAHDRRRPAVTIIVPHSQYFVVPPGAKAIIISPRHPGYGAPMARHWKFRKHWTSPGLHHRKRPLHEPRFSRPGWTTPGFSYGWTTPGFSHGWTTNKPGFGYGRHR